MLRLEYFADPQGIRSRKAFSVQDHRGATSHGQDTLTLALYYQFF